MNTLDIAHVCHDANRALQLATNDPAPPPVWEDTPEWQRASAVIGVHQAIDGATPEQLHQAWSEHKRADGWTYGTVKDAEAKTHPCLVAYADLPEEQRVKDDLFHAVVAALT